MAYNGFSIEELEAIGIGKYIEDSNLLDALNKYQADQRYEENLKIKYGARIFSYNIDILYNEIDKLDKAFTVKGVPDRFRLRNMEASLRKISDLRYFLKSFKNKPEMYEDSLHRNDEYISEKERVLKAWTEESKRLGVY